MVIAVVALIVIGPERLPTVARTLGHLFGRMQRYVNDVKADISREMELDELRKLQNSMQDAARSLEQSVTKEISATETEFQKLADAADPTATIGLDWFHNLDPGRDDGVLALKEGGHKVAVFETPQGGVSFILVQGKAIPGAPPEIAEELVSLRLSASADKRAATNRQIREALASPEGILDLSLFELGQLYKQGQFVLTRNGRLLPPSTWHSRGLEIDQQTTGLGRPIRGAYRFAGLPPVPFSDRWFEALRPGDDGVFYSNLVHGDVAKSVYLESEDGNHFAIVSLIGETLSVIPFSSGKLDAVGGVINHRITQIPDYG